MNGGQAEPKKIKLLDPNHLIQHTPLSVSLALRMEWVSTCYISEKCHENIEVQGKYWNVLGKYQ